MQIHMKSDRGEIEVFLCPEEDALNMGNAGPSGMTSEDSAAEDTDSEVNINSPLKIKKESDQYPGTDSGTVLSGSNHPSTSQMGHSHTREAPSRDEHSDESQAIRNVLIWESEDLGPIGKFQHQTVDQDHHDTTLTNDLNVSHVTQQAATSSGMPVHVPLGIVPHQGADDEGLLQLE